MELGRTSAPAVPSTGTGEEKRFPYDHQGPTVPRAGQFWTAKKPWVCRGYLTVTLTCLFWGQGALGRHHQLHLWCTCPLQLCWSNVHFHASPEARATIDSPERELEAQDESGFPSYPKSRSSPELCSELCS